jgi:hypothetical protein
MARESVRAGVDLRGKPTLGIRKPIPRNIAKSRFNFDVGGGLAQEVEEGSEVRGQRFKKLAN